MDAARFTEDVRVRRVVDQLVTDRKDWEISDVIDDEGHQYVDLVMEGGGVLGIALLGYTYALEKAGIRFLSIGGTSAGSIAALLLAAVDDKEHEKSEKIAVALANKDLYDFVDGPEAAKRLIRAALEDAGKLRLGMYYLGARSGFIRHLGFNPGKNFLGWMEETLAAHAVRTVRDLKARMNHVPPGLRMRDGQAFDEDLAELVIIAAEVSTETKVEFPAMAPLFWSNPEDMSPACFVRASMSVPYFFHPYRVHDIPTGPEAHERWRTLANYDGQLDETCVFVDGGIMSNFPINTFHNPYRVPSAPTLGVKLGTPTRQFRRFQRPVAFGTALFNAARHTLDYEFIRKNPDYNNLVAHIDTGAHNWLDFRLSDEAKVDLFRRGVEAAGNFLHSFDWPKYKQLRKSLIPAFESTFRAPGAGDGEAAKVFVS